MGRNIFGYSRIREMKQEIDNLKSQLAEKEKENSEEIAGLGTELLRAQQDRDSWKRYGDSRDSKLVEKEKEIEELKKLNDAYILYLQGVKGLFEKDTPVAFVEKCFAGETRLALSYEALKAIESVAFLIVSKKKELAEKEKEIANLQDIIETVVIGLNQTKKFFKSKKIAEIRFDLIKVLPVEKIEKLQRAGIIGGKVFPPEPWPENLPILPIGHNPSPPGPKPKAPPSPPPPEGKSIIIGYQPKSDKLDPSDPPQGGSAVRPPEPENLIIKTGISFK